MPFITFGARPISAFRKQPWRLKMYAFKNGDTSIIIGRLYLKTKIQTDLTDLCKYFIHSLTN